MLAWSLDHQVISRVCTLPPEPSLTRFARSQGDMNSLCKTVGVPPTLPRSVAQSVSTADKRGDRICMFGFSRGAYTARALAGMLRKVDTIPTTGTTTVMIPC